jgi:nonsense-mediated mRNA decay protein 3
MICVECGKESEIINNGLCLKCYIKSKRFSNGSELLEIIRCSNCNSYKFKNKWENQSLEQIIYRLLYKDFKINDELKKPEIKFQIIDNKNQYKKQLEVEISGSIFNIDIIEKHLIQINIKKEICDICSKKYGGYHEAIIQIRADRRNLTRTEINGIYTFVQDYIEDLQQKGNKNIFLTDFEKKENGLTFFISDNSIALTIIKKLQEIYSGDIKKSSKNIGMKDSKQIYRMTYLLRLYPYNKGDILSDKENFYYVKNISKDKINFVELEKWDENSYDVKDLNKFVKKGGDELIKDMILVSQTNDEVQIMDKNNYKIYIIRKPKKIFFNTDMIKIIQIQDRFFLLPL